MLSRLLIATTCVILTLMGSKEVLAAAISNVKFCEERAFRLYDVFTEKACDYKKSTEECMSDFNKNINGLDSMLDDCERSDYVTLCRIIPGSIWPRDDNCSSLVVAEKLTKEKCETMGKEDYVFHGADGSSTTFKGANSRCINAIDYDCHKLCG